MRRRLSRGEWRYTLMLVGILMLAAVATRTTMLHLQDLVFDVEYKAQTHVLVDYLAQDQSTLLSAAAKYHRMRSSGEKVESIHDDMLSLVAHLTADGDLLHIAPASHRTLSYDLPDDFIDRRSIVTSKRDQIIEGGWTGYANSTIGPVMIAIHRERESATCTAAIHPLDRVYISRLRNVISSCAGLQPFWALDDPDAQKYLHIEDFQGKRIGAFVLHPNLEAASSAVQTITLTLFAQTMGFLFLAGALGLGAIRVIATLEGRRRIAEFVNDLSYLSDGVVVTDRRGRITGANAAARELAAKDIESGVDELRDVFSFLSVEDMTLLMDRSTPHEVEHAITATHSQTLRLRSQPLNDVHLFLISDVTRENLRNQQERQLAQLQLIGRIARGVAHDFNNILCAISGHASLLMPSDERSENKESYDTIQREADRGAALARQLLDLSRVGAKEDPCDKLAEYTEKAVDLLRIAVRSSQQVDLSIQGHYPTVSLSGTQIEQVVVNLGLLCSDEQSQEGYIKVSLHPPSEMPPYDTKPGMAAVILIAAHTQAEYPDIHHLRPFAGELGDDLGVLYSVIRSIVGESGGNVERMVGPHPISCFRVSLQQLDPDMSSQLLFGQMSDDMKAYVKGWRVLVGLPDSPYRNKVSRCLQDAGMRVEMADDIVSCLGKIQSEEEFNGIVVAQSILGHESSGLVQAILKLKPGAGIVLLSEEATTTTEPWGQHVVYESIDDAPEAVLNMLVRASRLAELRTS